MQITRQADYALRAMLFLAKNPTNERASTSHIAEIQQIPPSFLAKIISQLSIAGLIHTSRGARGGVSLARSVEDISVLDVIEAIDGPISLNDCSHSKDGCPFGEECPLQPIWCEAQSDLVNKLHDTKFSQLISEPVKDL